jgi:hypothetical protein
MVAVADAHAVSSAVGKGALGDGAERETALRDALTAAGAISDGDYRARALAALAPHLPETLFPDALAAARAISDVESAFR